MLVSYLLFAYNQERFVEAALRSALEQTYPLVELIVTDDGSSDGTVGVIEQVLAGYRGPKTVVFNRRPINGGLGAAINSAAALANGEYIVVAAGDDISLPHRAEVLMAAFRSDPDVRCLHSAARYIDEHGTPGELHADVLSASLTAASFARPMAGLLGATAAYHRDVFQRFGPLTDRLAAEDKVLPLRAAMLGTIRRLDEPLVEYRRHGGNVWLGATNRARDYVDWHRQLVGRRLAMSGVVQQRLDDMAAFAAEMPADGTVLNPVRQANANALARLRIEHELLTTPRLDRKLRQALRFAASQPGTLKQKWGWIKQFVWPRSYHKGASPEERARAITRA